MKENEAADMGLNFLGKTSTEFYMAAQALREIKPLRETIDSMELTIIAHVAEIEAWRVENEQFKARIAELEKRWEDLELFIRTTPGLNHVLHEIERLEEK